MELEEELRVVGNNSQLLLELHNLSFSILGPFFSPLQVSLALGKLLGNLLVLLIRIFCLCSCLLKILLQKFHPLLIILALILQNFAHTLRVVGSGGGLIQLLYGLEQLLFVLLQVLLQTLNSPVESVHLGLGGQEGLLLLLKLHGPAFV